MTPCDCTAQLSDVVSYLEQQLCPALEESLENNAEWWTLKERSPLRNYIFSLGSENPLDEYFTPNVLIEFIKDQAYRLSLIDPGNAAIILTDNSPLNTCFKSSIIYIPELYNHLLPHVNVVCHAETLLSLKHNAIKDEIYVETPSSIILQDPLAQFWLPTIFNQIICKNKKITYSWSELHDLFHEFFTSNSNHFVRLDDSACQITPSSPLATFFKFTYFHKNQITALLHHITQYLGTTSNILTFCPKLQFLQWKSSDPFVMWLENMMYRNYKRRSVCELGFQTSWD